MAMRTGGAVRSTAENVKCDIQEILQSGNYYVTEEIARELSVINNALEHLSLDDTFLSTSEDWQRKPGNFTARQTADHLAGAMQAVNMVCNTLYNCKHQLASRNLLGKQENELRELHQCVISSLKNLQNCLEPYVFDAADRIKQFGDTIGVTDRYTGFRQNLTRDTRDPFRLQSSWMNKSGELGMMNNLTRSHTTMGCPTLDQRVIQSGINVVGDPSGQYSEFGPVPPANIGAMKKQIKFGDGCSPMRVTRGYRTIDSLYPKSTTLMNGKIPYGNQMLNEVNAINDMNARDFYQKLGNVAHPVAKAPFEQMSVQEQAGINTTFPGRTEYMQSYKSPATNVPTSDLKINPCPNYAIYGQPLQQSCYIPSFTEYKTRYEWPDAEKIVKLPWLRN